MKPRLYIIIFLALLIIMVKGCLMAGSWAFSGSRDDLVILQESLPDNLDPAKNTSYEKVLPLTGIYEGLVKLNPETLAPEPCLARSWSMSEDGKRWTFNLYPGIKFGDGTPCNAEAVRASMIRSMSLKEKEPYPALLFAPVTAIDAEGEYTVSFTLSQPFTPFLKDLALPFAAPVVSPASLSGYGGDFWKHPSGTGPYMLDKFSKNKIVLRSNPYFRGAAAPTGKVTFRAEADPGNRAKQLLGGQADIIFYPDSASMEALKSKGMQVQSLPGLDISYIGFYTDKPPFSDRELRRVISGVLDREKIVSSVLKGDGVPAAGILPPVLSNARSFQKPIYTPGQVREILARKGYPGGMDITLITYEDHKRYCVTGGKALAEEIKLQLEPAGIRVNIETRPWNDHKEAIRNKRGDLFLYGWTCDNGDPDNFLHTLFYSSQINSGLNASRFVNPKMDVYLLTARRIADGKARKLLYDQAEDIIQQEVPVIPLNHSLSRIAAAPGVEGIQLSGFGLINLNSLKKD